MASPKRRKRAGPSADEEETTSDEGSRAEDIYESEERDEMLENDEITAAEEGFMRGREMEMKEMEGGKKKGRKSIIHDDGTSVTLNAGQYEED